MQVQVRGKGVVVTEALRDYADKRVNKLTKHFHSLHTAVVTQTIQGKMHRVEVQLEGDGVKVRCEDRGDDLYAAIDRVAGKLERQMQKYKDRSVKTSHHHYGNHGEVSSPRTAPVVIEGLEEEAAQTGRIVRHKRFGIKPLSPGDAVNEMELLSHSFFVFENSQSGDVNVLYRQEDGNYGILEPER
ncbi:MAG: ribosome-associated translation inhibitor RaiA [Cytophagales bacterium]|nr:ribosome-associated translation inhibitor RaiA [Armatimonadota bacterium]